MLQLIHNTTVPCLCVAKNQAAVSRMVRGLAPSQLPMIDSSSEDSIGSQVANWLRKHFDTLRQSRVQRDCAWKQLDGLDLSRAVALAEIVDLPVSPMRLIREQFESRLKDNDDLLGALTLFQLAYIAITQKWHLIPSSSGFLAFEPDIVLPDGVRNRNTAGIAARASLGNLWIALQQSKADESNARQAWMSYLEELSLNAARKEKKAKTAETLTRSVKEWCRILRAKDEL